MPIRSLSEFQAIGSPYFLLPFKFTKINESFEILVNEYGDFLICEIGTAKNIAEHKILKNDSIYPDLISNFFISEKPIPDLIDVISTRYRTKKSFLDTFTSLHIFVVTLRCDHQCKYCQVSRRNKDQKEYDISETVIDKSIQLMFKSPSKELTVEFQGGEPLLAFEKVIYIVNRVLEMNLIYKRQITFVLCTNLTQITQDVIDFCKNQKIIISTSYDGPEYIHNINRPIAGFDSHAIALEGIRTFRESIGSESVSALITCTDISYGYPKEIIDDYIKQGFNSIFLRPLNPYGFAKKNYHDSLALVENFIDFYKKALSYIIDLNMNGIFFIEEYACIILTKILTPFPVGFTDLQSPSGIINNVIVYNYDGYVYASDESRMLAEEGDYTFRLGHVEKNTYKEIFYGEKALKISDIWSNESLPGCSDCAFQIYCGADPVRNYSTQNDMVGNRATSVFCKKNFEIIRYLFELIANDKEIKRIFQSWVNRINL